MARPDQTKAVKKMKDAKTVKEMLNSWADRSPGMGVDKLYEDIRPLAERYPYLLEHYCHRALQNIIDRGVLDRKTMELVLLRMFLAIPGGGGKCAVEQVANCKAAGCTDDEIVDVAEGNLYVTGKDGCFTVFGILNYAFEQAKNVKLYKP